jgi:hypothetical protein
MKFEFTPEAFRELHRIARRYNRVRRGHGGKFIAEVYRVSDLLASSPWLGKRRGRYREHPLSKFPYVLECQQNDDMVEITFMLHKRRRSPGVREPAGRYAVNPSYSLDRAAA